MVRILRRICFGSNPTLPLLFLALISLVLQTGCAASRPIGSYQEYALLRLMESAKTALPLEERQRLGDPEGDGTLDVVDLLTNSPFTSHPAPPFRR